MRKNLYMHTVNGDPAVFNGEQILIVGKNNQVKFEDLFVDSLTKIKEQQQQNKDFCDARKIPLNQFYHSYLRVNCPLPDDGSQSLDGLTPTELNAELNHRARKILALEHPEIYQEQTEKGKG